MNLSRIFVATAFLAAFSNLIADQFDTFQTEQLAGPSRLLTDLKKQDLTLSPGIAKAALTDILPMVDGEQIISQSLYQHAATPYTQTVLDLPALYRTTPLKTGINVSAFFDQTHTLNYGNNPAFATDLLAIDALTPILKPVAETWLPLLKLAQDSSEAATIFEIYNKTACSLYAQERRLGAVVDAFKCTEDGLIIGIRIPVYYTERNWNISPAQQSEPQADTKRLYPYAVDDTFGIDDARIVMGTKVLDTGTFTTVIGAEITAPSSIALKRGIMGTGMTVATQPEFINIGKFTEPLLLGTENDTVVLQDLGKHAVYQLGAIGLGTPLGHEHQPAVAVFADQHAQIAEGFSIFARIRGTALLPRTRSTYLAHIPKADDFNLDDLEFEEREEVFEQRLNFLSYMLTRNIFPVKADIATHIRFMSQFMCGLTVDITPSWQAFAGAEVWHMTTERIKGVYPHAQSYYPLKTDGLERPKCYQTKIFGGYTYTDLRASGDLHASMCIDSTLVGKGIGNNNTVSFTLSKLF